MLRVQLCPPTISTLLSTRKPTVIATEGEKLILTCDVSTFYQQFIIWGKRSYLLTGGSLDKDRNWIYSSVHSELEGIYTCYVDTLCGVEQNEIPVIVKGNREPILHVEVNQTARLTCPQSTNVTFTTVNWFKENAPLLPSFDPHFKISEKNGSLEILEAQESDTGRYRCEIQTSQIGSPTTIILHVTKSVSPTFLTPSGVKPSDVTPSGISTFAVIAIVGSLFFGFVLLIMWRIWTKKKNSGEGLTDEEIREFRNGHVSLLAEEDNYGIEEITYGQPYDRSYELPYHAFQIERESVLGQGQFGIVCKGTLKVGDKLETVAFKSTKSHEETPEVHKRELKSLLSEVKLMIYIGNHPHIIRLVGAYTRELKNGVVYVALEFCSNGSLEKLLRTSKHASEEVEGDQPNIQANNTTPSLIVTISLQGTWALQVAKGMEYLQSKKIVHADLATRNILVASDLSIRITDFGLSRRLENYENYVKTGQEPLPWRWMALESLECRNFSSASDVWSYGVTLWEIYSMAKLPYLAHVWTPDFLAQLKAGERLPLPLHAPDYIYAQMKDCWNLNPAERPTFIELVRFFQQVDYTNKNIVYL